MLRSTRSVFPKKWQERVKSKDKVQPKLERNKKKNEKESNNLFLLDGAAHGAPRASSYIRRRLFYDLVLCSISFSSVRNNIVSPTEDIGLVHFLVGALET